MKGNNDKMQGRDWKNEMERQKRMFQKEWTFDILVPSEFPLFQDSDIWIPDHLWTQAAVEKVAVVLA